MLVYLARRFADRQFLFDSVGGRGFAAAASRMSRGLTSLAFPEAVREAAPTSPGQCPQNLLRRKYAQQPLGRRLLQHPAEKLLLKLLKILGNHLLHHKILLKAEL